MKKKHKEVKMKKSHLLVALEKLEKNLLENEFCLSDEIRLNLKSRNEDKEYYNSQYNLLCGDKIFGTITIGDKVMDAIVDYDIDSIMCMPKDELKSLVKSINKFRTSYIVNVVADREGW